VRNRGGSRCVLAGISDLAEIATICAVENGVTIVAIVDPRTSEQRYAGVPVVPLFEALGDDFDAVMVTDIGHAREVAVTAVRRFGAQRVFVPALLDVRLAGNGEDGA
jgi:hypothetical protein